MKWTLELVFSSTQPYTTSRSHWHYTSLPTKLNVSDRAHLCYHVNGLGSGHAQLSREVSTKGFEVCIELTSADIFNALAKLTPVIHDDSDARKIVLATTNDKRVAAMECRFRATATKYSSGKLSSREISGPLSLRLFHDNARRWHHTLSNLVIWESHHAGMA
ncbi:hypothetical protein EI94DRAFT_445685 [Lactarius quietus]|nr:hypothetical protein EI94DRAFT_445685 [Lactarius quietus]